MSRPVDTWEADVHWFYKRAQLDSALLGAPADTVLHSHVMPPPASPSR